ncbi:family 43 glycosylhydrolase [Altererythrobacter indicus]|uniref:Extracellular exo-alpha-(1->5)-L-arabinofuranosidase n=1 Tax=Altericroceibacterium indicum TaxID=374177 RepID=A0A845AE47_9SPHN|nr:arabinan endo-1,5-alpha-L-arabinosidase [Altericroceibacterium indicum]MXP27075.1 family 43 glycosylhydrolase [Altericroceibacterium indicum]
MLSIRARSVFSPYAAGVLFFAAAWLAGCAAPLRTVGGVSGDISPVHDPAMIKLHDEYVLFVTSHQNTPYAFLPVRTSRDLTHWTFRGPVIPRLPEWAEGEVPGVSGIWAPDVLQVGHQTRLYYSLSRFGENRSAIGLLTNDHFDPEKPSAGWVDRGLVFRSGPGDDFNAIDPNVLVDEAGRHWLSFGSFWSGIKLIELNPETGLPLADAPLHAIARRAEPGAIEAPFLYAHGGYYYLFASFDRCCMGVKSTYHVMVGRSRAVTGPYLDKEGRDMMDGGGSVVLRADLEADQRFKGPGHEAVLRDGERDLIIYHAYDAKREGTATLRIQQLDWSADGWPTAVPLTKRSD